VARALLLAFSIDAIFLERCRAERGAAAAPRCHSRRSGCGRRSTPAASGARSALAGLVKSDLRTRLTHSLFARGPAAARAERTGELTAVSVEGVEAVDAYAGQYLPQSYLAGIAPLIVLIAAFALDPLSGLVLLVTGPIVIVFMVLIGSTAREHTDKRWHDLRWMGAHLLDVVQGLTDAQALRAQPGRGIRRVEAVSRALRYNTTMEVLRVAFLSGAALELLASLSTAIVAVEVGLRLLYAQIPFAPALAVLMLAPAFYAPLRTLGARHHDGMAGREALARIFDGHRHEDEAPDQ
jgi:ABC-type transport system involved in cytochrome bd biosynthesis fused ATPase/permease subunit